MTGPPGEVTGLPGDWHRLHPLSPLVRSGRAAVGVLAIVGVSASGQFGHDGSHLYDWALAVLVVAMIATMDKSK